MRKSYLILCLSIMLGISAGMNAQVAPEAGSLKHLWTFDDGNGVDEISGLNGTIEGAAVYSNKALNTSAGGYMTLDGSALALNAYTEATVEVWFTSVPGANPSYHMLTYFGNMTPEGNGSDYWVITPARGNNVSRACISTNHENDSPSNETGIDGQEFDDGVLHHMVTVLSQTTISFYIDGVNMGTADLTNNNSISGIGTSLAMFGKGGFRNDPVWKGKFHKVGIYNKALTDENIVYLHQQGAEDKPVITTSVNSFAFDTNYPAEMMTVNVANLTQDVVVTAPAGITCDPTIIPANSTNTDIVVVYDGTTSVNGVITLKSGTAEATVDVKAVSDAECFVPLYVDNTNLIPDPGCNNISLFTGWGTKESVKITTDSANVYCGASSIRIGDGEKGGSGSLDFRLDGMLFPNTTYRVKVACKTIGLFQVGLERIDVNNPANNTILKQIDTGGEWQILDYTFSTGDVVADNPVIYINNWSLNGTLGYFDNWEMYAVPDPIITTTATSLAFDPEYKSASFNVTAANLAGDITITAPAGITVEPATLPANAASVLVTVSYDGTTVVDGILNLKSGDASVDLKIKTANSSLGCFTPLYTDRDNLIPDPFFNDINNFAGWKNKSVISVADYPDSVYCGSHTGKIFLTGSIDVPLVGKMLPNYNYISKVMVKTIGGRFHMGINGHDLKNFSGDFTDTIQTDGQWKEFIFNFHTGDSVRIDPVIFFNNDRDPGQIAYLDNWELYQTVEYSAVNNVSDFMQKLYVKNDKIVVEFEANSAAQTSVSIYNVHGGMVASEVLQSNSGRNVRELNANLPSGIYIVKMNCNNETSFRKLVK